MPLYTMWKYYPHQHIHKMQKSKEASYFISMFALIFQYFTYYKTFSEDNLHYQRLSHSLWKCFNTGDILGHQTNEYLHLLHGWMINFISELEFLSRIRKDRNLIYSVYVYMFVCVYICLHVYMFIYVYRHVYNI